VGGVQGSPRGGLNFLDDTDPGTGAMICITQRVAATGRQRPSAYAVQVVSSPGDSWTSPDNDPLSTLGAPATRVLDRSR